MTSLKPILKWAGGKRWLVPELEKYWQPHRHRRLVEPFCGGLSVALGLNPERALLNDGNSDLMNFYWHLKQGLVIISHMENDESGYYKKREIFNWCKNDGREIGAYSAGLFYYLNKTGFNGLCRYNKKGEYNVPYGHYKKINYQKDFREYQSVFSKWEFSNEDFQDLELLPDDFIYADPPYDSTFTGYTNNGFNWDDQVRLAKWLGKHKGPVIISNQATPRIQKLYSELGFELRFLEGPRRISCKGGGRQPKKEVLAFKNIN